MINVKKIKEFLRKNDGWLLTISLVLFVASSALHSFTAFCITGLIALIVAIWVDMSFLFLWVTTMLATALFTAFFEEAYFKHGTKTVLSQEPLREVIFADDTYNIVFKQGVTETIFSEDMKSDKEEYYKMKSTYMMHNEDKNHFEQCYMVTSNVKVDTIGFDENKTEIECY